MKVSKSKWVNGPGGIDCRCCRVGKKSEAKRRSHRSQRRAYRQNGEKE